MKGMHVVYTVGGVRESDDVVLSLRFNRLRMIYIITILHEFSSFIIVL